MSNPYTQPSISGYNASDTQDDGTTTVTWALSKTEIGDPIKDFLDSVKANLTTAFGARLLNTFVDKDDDYTVQTSDQGALIAVTVGGKTITLPAAATAGENFVVAVVNRADTAITVDGNTSETIDGATTLTLDYDGAWALLVCDGSGWRAIKGMDTLENGGTEVRVIKSQVTGIISTTELTDLTISGIREDREYRYRLFVRAEHDGFGIKLNVAIDSTGINTRYANVWGFEDDEQVDSVSNSYTWDPSTGWGSGNAFLHAEGGFSVASGADQFEVRAVQRAGGSVGATIDAYTAFLIIEDMGDQA